MERWVEHYAELSTRKNMMSLEALNSIQYLPVLEDLDSEPTEPSEGSSKDLQVLAQRFYPENIVWFPYQHY